MLITVTTTSQQLSAIFSAAQNTQATTSISSFD